jgi:hypothetical protein
MSDPVRPKRRVGHMREQVDEPLLICGLDGEDVDERHKLGFLRDRGHRDGCSPSGDGRARRPGLRRTLHHWRRGSSLSASPGPKQNRSDGASSSGPNLVWGRDLGSPGALSPAPPGRRGGWSASVAVPQRSRSRIGRISTEPSYSHTGQPSASVVASSSRLLKKPVEGIDRFVMELTFGACVERSRSRSRC